MGINGPLTLGGAVLLGLAGCAAGPTLGLQQVGDFSLVTHVPSDVQQQALAEGVLGTVGGCIAINSDDHTYLIAFPSTAILEGSGRVTLAGADLELGERVSLAGGFTALDTLSESTLNNVPNECLTEEIFFVN
jgi:hypothetical protein